MSILSKKQDPEAGWPKTNGMTVPEGYFEDFANRMMAQIPQEPTVQAEEPRTLWMRVRPYIYMAAMFAGIYLMMHIFTLTAGIGGSNAENATSDLLAEVVNNNTTSYLDDYISMSEYDLYDDLYEAGYEIPE